ncbi:MAG: hypothetical protein PHD32_02510 [Eubacteriales bacterium]|nr:hypothetical protein [Eubacteriales bacterium]
MNEYEVTTRVDVPLYRRFVFAGMFRPKYVMYEAAVGAIGAGAVAALLGKGSFSWALFVGMLLLMEVVAFGAVAVKAELLVRRRIKTDQTGFFNAPYTLSFEEKSIKLVSEALQSTQTLAYDKLYRCESRSAYYAFYSSAQLATLLARADVPPQDAAELDHFLQEKFGSRYRRSARSGGIRKGGRL